MGVGAQTEQQNANLVSPPTEHGGDLLALTERAKAVRVAWGAFQNSFAEWALLVEQQQHEAAEGREILKDTLGENPG